MSEINDALAAGREIERATTAIQTLTHGDRTFLVIPAGRVLHTFEPHGDRPTSKRGTLILHDEPAFVAYVLRHRGDGLHVFANSEDSTVTAILDYHDDAGAGWGRHRVTLPIVNTESWLEWNAADGDRLEQFAFAEWLENHLTDIVEPPGAEVLELAMNLEIKRGVVFSSAIRLDNGQTQLVYDETVQGGSRKGEVKIPDRIKLALKPFEGAPAYALWARFRYRLAAGQLSLWVDLLRADEVLRAAFDDRVVAIQTGLGDAVQVLRGVAPPPSAPL